MGSVGSNDGWAGNYYDVWDNNQVVPAPNHSTQWSLTWDRTTNEDFHPLVQKNEIWDMWPSPDLIQPQDHQSMIEDVFALVKSQSGCRLPLNNPQLDTYDAALIAAVGSGAKLYPPETAYNMDLFPGQAYQPNPAHQASGISSGFVVLSWRQSDETDTFDLHFGENIKGQEPPLFASNLPGVGEGNTRTFTVTVQSGKSYAWRVYSKNGCGSSQQSSKWSFSTL